MHPWIHILTSQDPEVRNRSFPESCQTLSFSALREGCRELEMFRHRTQNLYQRVRATLFLYAAHRFFLMGHAETPDTGSISLPAHESLLTRRFEEAVHALLHELEVHGPNAALFSALAEAYHRLAFQSLMDQVRHSVRSSWGNQWMFRISHPQDHPLRVRQELRQRPEGAFLYPILHESTPVRLDLSHSGWSDIFFLGMDYPEGARVLNISVELGVYSPMNGRNNFAQDKDVRPPIDSYLRVIDEPVLRLTSIDLKATCDIADLDELFHFAKDHLGLLKAGIIASGLIPPSCEGTGQTLEPFLARLAGPGMGIELVTRVNDIPKGSRLAVSTNLLASIISLIMRATGQTEFLEGPLNEEERRLVASRAILGEWLGGSGGGWQDSGGIWPGIKIIEGALAQEGDPEFGISKGCLLPRHKVLSGHEIHPEITRKLADSLVLIHGGMAQNVGPILEMVTERYLLRSGTEWEARQAMQPIFHGMLDALKEGDIRSLADRIQKNWDGPLKTIIPWISNRFTETIIARARKALKDDFWGFVMLGGMSGGGMGMFVNPSRRQRFCDEILAIMNETKQELRDALPFAMDPVVYDFRINEQGTVAHLLAENQAVMPALYYSLQVPELVRKRPEDIPFIRRAELEHFTGSSLPADQSFNLLRGLVSNLFKVRNQAAGDNPPEKNEAIRTIKKENGFDAVQHEQLRQDLRAGRIGLLQNRLPVDTTIEDVEDMDLQKLGGTQSHIDVGEAALKRGTVAVLTLAAGVGSRWTQGAGVIKALCPFVEALGRHRSFFDIHLAKTRKSRQRYGGASLPHIFTTSYLTHGPMARHLEESGILAMPPGQRGVDSGEGVHLSPGRSIGARLIPMVRDLRFLWEETSQETLDEQKQRMLASAHQALMDWARTRGEGNDYLDNLPTQLFSPPGHWYEVPNLLRNGVLARLLKQQPDLQTLMLHNVDTLGAHLDPEALGRHLESGHSLTFEVVPRRMGDTGGGLARVNGKVRLLEGLAQPRETDELKLRYYNTMTTWIQIDPLLKLFELTRKDLSGPNEAPEEAITAAIRRIASRLPTYVTLKNVKLRWGHGQEDVFPVTQFEKLWSDMTSLPDLSCGFLAVPRQRGQQLKDPSELDSWVLDGSRDYVMSLCDFGEGL